MESQHLTDKELQGQMKQVLGFECENIWEVSANCQIYH